MPLKVALFAEGSGESSPSRRESGALSRIWGEVLPRALGCASQIRVFPFSKRDLVALDRSKPQPTGSIPLDVLIAARLAGPERLDAVLIAWDLQPPWDPKVNRCRWQETLDIYRFLGASAALKGLSGGWRRRAQARHDDLAARATPGARTLPHRLARHEIAVVCMEPMFESILLDEPGIFAALGLTRRPPLWPKAKEWKAKGLRMPDQALLKPAIDAALASKVRARIVDQIGGDLKTRKNEWGAYLLESLLAEHSTRTRCLSRQLPRRLTEVLP